MTVQYKVDFFAFPWQFPIEEVRHKYLDQDGTRMRLIEYTKAMPLHWCEKGHYCYLIEGQMKIEFEDEKIIYNPGDGIFIPDGPEHRHRGRSLPKRCWCSL
jgi:quercetin dioxygenase-like cupin family protein